MSILNGLNGRIQRLEEKVPKPVEPMMPYEYSLSDKELLVIDQFLSIDENLIPGWDVASGTYPGAPKRVLHNVHYTLHRTNFRATCDSMRYAKTRGRLGPDDLEMARIWLEAFTGDER